MATATNWIREGRMDSTTSGTRRGSKRDRQLKNAQVSTNEASASRRMYLGHPYHPANVPNTPQANRTHRVDEEM